jgi:hypothetical protein
VTIAVSGSPTPTGAVTLAGGGYTSAATTLSGGSATISIPAGSLATGSDQLTATYTPDSSSSSIYNGALGTTSVTVSISGTGAGPQLSFLPGSRSTLGGYFSILSGLAMDPSGNVFVTLDTPTVNETGND